MTTMVHLYLCGYLSWTVVDRDNLPNYDGLFDIRYISLGVGGGWWSHTVKLKESSEEERGCMGHEFIC